MLHPCNIPSEVNIKLIIYFLNDTDEVRQSYNFKFIERKTLIQGTNMPLN